LQQYQQAEKARREKEEIDKKMVQKGEDVEKEGEVYAEEYDSSAKNSSSNTTSSLGSQNSTETDAKNDTMKERNKKILLIPPVEPKAKTLKVKLDTIVTLKDVKDLTSEQLESARNVLAKFEHAENEKHKREEAMNALEALVYDLAIKIQEGEEFAEYLTSEEKEQLAEELKRLRTWMEDDADINTSTDDFVSNKAILDKLTASGHRRKSERLMLPKAIESLNNLLNHSLAFYDVALNMTTSDDPVFTTTELEVFYKLITSTTEWWKEKNASYVEQQKHEDPVVTTEELATKIRGVMDLDRELKYLLNKMKIFKPKKKEQKKSSTSGETVDSSTTAANRSAEVENGLDGEKTSNERFYASLQFKYSLLAPMKLKSVLCFVYLQETRIEAGTGEKGQEHDPSEL
uniref:Hypoxia up-regulated protein 1 n=1 Tax=Angiostrongylus cantonensis TaxID=6313 RepID=A0A0K0D7P3_ANGCA